MCGLNPFGQCCCVNGSPVTHWALNKSMLFFSLPTPSFLWHHPSYLHLPLQDPSILPPADHHTLLPFFSRLHLLSFDWAAELWWGCLSSVVGSTVPPWEEGNSYSFAQFKFAQLILFCNLYFLYIILTFFSICCKQVVKMEKMSPITNFL